MKHLFLAMCAFFSFSETFSQGKIDGFYRGKGNTTAVFGLGFEDNKNYFIGEEKSDISRSLYYVNLYGAHGITEDFDVSLSIPFLSSNKNSGLQDMLLFLKYRVFQKEIGKGNLQLSLAGGFSTPLSDYELGGLNDIGQQATVIESRAMVHYQWHSGWFTTLQSGYSYKFEETPSSLPITFKAGKAAGKWYYDMYYDYQHSFGGIDYRGTPSPQNFKEFGSDFHKIGSTVYRSLGKNFGGFISLSYVLSGRNVFQGPGYGLGLVYDFRKK
ncbi:transporter [Ulvibacter antarcticus]|uniref:Uncharacterized protein n=1 Tax=Ulvibacter antarcticus TaxID=442714 RepID=A0A3L9Y8Q2_9FLAO|nr:transporter [Ulvibacter antarcticus]RMA57063.1 hypothetical protein BXY75_2944 [Ulvibacter antarcticus]